MSVPTGLNKWHQYTSVETEVHPALQNDPSSDGGLHRKGFNYNPLKAAYINGHSSTNNRANNFKVGKSFNDRKTSSAAIKETKGLALKSILKNPNHPPGPPTTTPVTPKQQENNSSASINDTSKLQGSTVTTRSNKTVYWPNVKASTFTPGNDKIQVHTGILPVESYLSTSKRYTDVNSSSIFRIPGPVKTFIDGKEVISENSTSKGTNNSQITNEPLTTSKSESQTHFNITPAKDHLINTSNKIKLQPSVPKKTEQPSSHKTIQGSHNSNLNSKDTSPQNNPNTSENQSCGHEVHSKTVISESYQLKNTKNGVIHSKSDISCQLRSDSPTLNKSDNKIEVPYNTEPCHNSFTLEASKKKLSELSYSMSIAIPEVLQLNKARLEIVIEIGAGETRSLHLSLTSGCVEESIRNFCKSHGLENCVDHIRHYLFSAIMYCSARNLFVNNLRLN